MDIAAAVIENKIKWTHESTIDSDIIEEKLLKCLVTIPDKNIKIITNAEYNKKRSGRARSPNSGTRPKIRNNK